MRLSRIFILAALSLAGACASPTAPERISAPGVATSDLIADPNCRSGYSVGNGRCSE